MVATWWIVAFLPSGIFTVTQQNTRQGEGLVFVPGMLNRELSLLMPNVTVTLTVLVMIIDALGHFETG